MWLQGATARSSILPRTSIFGPGFLNLGSYVTSIRYFYKSAIAIIAYQLDMGPNNVFCVN